MNIQYLLNHINHNRLVFLFKLSCLMKTKIEEKCRGKYLLFGNYNLKVHKKKYKSDVLLSVLV